MKQESGEAIIADDDSVNSGTEMFTDSTAAAEISRPTPSDGDRDGDRDTSCTHHFGHTIAFNHNNSYTNANNGAMSGVTITSMSTGSSEEWETYYASLETPHLLPLGQLTAMATRGEQAEDHPLEPSRRMIKVLPEDSGIRPGAYSFSASSEGDNDSFQTDDDLTTTQDDTSIVVDPPWFDRVPTNTIEHDPTNAIEDEPTNSIQGPVLTAMEESVGARTHKCSQKYKWIGAGMLVMVIVIIGVGVGVGVGVSQSRPSSPSVMTNCSMKLITEECTANGNTLPMGPHECVIARYNDLQNNFIPLLNGAIIIDSNSCSPENLALISLALYTTEQDSLTLLKNRFGLSIFFFATNGHEWKSNNGWLTFTSHCDWYGIECGPPNAVKVISMSWNNVQGYLPSSLPILVSNLSGILLENNALTGTLPVEFGELENINVGFNMLSGIFPSTLFSSTKTVTLLVHNNNFDLSPRPTSFRGTQWQELSLNELNFESGALSMELFALTMLTALGMSNTNVVGTLPSEIGQLTKLEQLILQQNSLFHGTLPTELGNLALLSILDLSLCSISGSIPSELGRLTELTLFGVEYNNLSGTIPTELGLLTNLQQFTFGGNTFHGTLSTEVCALRNGTLTIFGSVLCNSNDQEGEFYSGLTCSPDNLACCKIIC